MEDFRQVWDWIISGASFRDFTTQLMRTTVSSSPTGAAGLMKTTSKLFKNALKRKSLVTIDFFFNWIWSINNYTTNIYCMYFRCKGGSGVSGSSEEHLKSTTIQNINKELKSSTKKPSDMVVKTSTNQTVCSLPSRTGRCR